MTNGRGTSPTFGVTTSRGQNTQQTRKFLWLDVNDPRKLVDMYTVGIVHEDVSDVLPENNTDARIVICLHELGMMVINVGVIGRKKF